MVKAQENGVPVPWQIAFMRLQVRKIVQERYTSAY